MSLESIKQEYTLILTAHDMEEMQNKICMEINQHQDQQLKEIKKHINEQVSEKIKEQYDKELNKMIETCEPIDGRGLKVAIQVIPVVKKVGYHVKVRLVGNLLMVEV